MRSVWFRTDQHSFALQSPCVQRGTVSYKLVGKAEPSHSMFISLPCHITSAPVALRLSTSPSSVTRWRQPHAERQIVGSANPPVVDQPLCMHVFCLPSGTFWTGTFYTRYGSLDRWIIIVVPLRYTNPPVEDASWRFNWNYSHRHAVISMTATGVSTDSWP